MCDVSCFSVAKGQKMGALCRLTGALLGVAQPVFTFQPGKKVGLYGTGSLTLDPQNTSPQGEEPACHPRLLWAQGVGLF